MLTFGIPIVGEVYAGLDSELPFATRVFLNIAEAIKNNWYFLLAGIVILAIAAVKWYKSKKGRYTFDKMLLKLPILGSLLKRLAISRFARTLSTLYSAGIHLIQSLKMVSTGMGNVVMEKAVLD